MFRFNFQLDEEDKIASNTFEPSEPTDTHEESNRQQVSQPTTWLDAVEVELNDNILETLDYYSLQAKEIKYGDTTIRHIVSGTMLEDIKTDDENAPAGIHVSENKHSDLLPGVYEGGAKIWECTDDLLDYMANNFADSYWESKHVLDLGCGSGLLGIYAQKHDATVHYQDYNCDVLEKITMPNVLMNMSSVKTENDNDSLDDSRHAFERTQRLAKFYAGDWAKFATLTEPSEPFDVILTSETIYNPANQIKLLDTCAKRLKRDGHVLVAAKTHYFGVGGGTRQFEAQILTHGVFKSSKLWSGGAVGGIEREILELKFL